MTRLILPFICALPLLAGAATLPIITPAKPSPDESLAAHEVRRYVYLRTGALLSIHAPSGKPAEACILVARKDQPEIQRLAGDESALKTTAVLKPQEYLLKKTGANSLFIVGGDDAGVLYGVYAFAEKLGVRFYLHGDVVPDERMPFSIPELNETGKPLFAMRGGQPFHDFPEGPDWWSGDDYLACVSQLAKMRMNFIGLHCYPETSAGPEPLIWIGQKADCDALGRVKFSYPSFWANTAKAGWGRTPGKTSDFAAGASLLFPGDVFGSEVQAGLMPLPKSPKECNEVFNRAGAMLGKVFAHASKLGVKTCIGTETPLAIPAAVKDHLKSMGKNPADPTVVRDLYEGLFTRVRRASPVDYYWLWTPENWTWSGNKPEQLAATIRDIQAALEALQSLGKPFTLATCGWVLGPQDNRAALDAFLPKDSPMSCINRTVGHDPVEVTFASITGRLKWAIPWMENDPTLTQPQPWVGRMRYDAADARRLGCTGLLGIHWRTKAMMQNVSALASAAWDQSWVPASFDTNIVKPPPISDGAIGGTAVSFTTPVANTDEPQVYQTVRYGMSGYSLTVPDGSYSVTVQFNEPHYNAAGKRVFGVKIQGRQVIDTLDIFAKVGRNRALDYTFDRMEVSNGLLRIDFTPQIEYPCIAGIVVDGTAKAGNHFGRKINCGGATYKDYEADRLAGPPVTADRNRAMPCDDFYTDFACANFGKSVAQEAGAIMASVDGVKMPKITEWLKGPGCILPNATPWEAIQKQFAFVESFAQLRPQIRGGGNLQRFDYWLNTYRAAQSIARLGCLRGELDRAVSALKTETDPARKTKLIAHTLAVRLAMARAWEKLISCQIAACDTPGDLGTLVNLELQSRRTKHMPVQISSGPPPPPQSTKPSS